MAHFVRVGSDLEILDRLALFGDFIVSGAPSWPHYIVDLTGSVICKPPHLFKPADPGDGKELKFMTQSETNKIRILGRSALCHSAVLGYPDLEGGCRGWVV